jgi:CRP/FNR family nitrogen fixation transcriptional regulator
MFVRTTADSKPRPNTLGEFGLRSGGSDPIVSLSEFTYKKETEIYGEKESADYVYQVRSGAVRSYKLLSDGRRQICAFHLVGDIFGLTSEATHRFTAEAVVDTTLWLIKRQNLEVMAKNDGVLVHNLLSETTKNLRHAEEHMLLLGRKQSSEKVATFLLEMDKRLAGTTALMALPMTRLDIADYLGLTVETVSRALHRLQRAGILTFSDNKGYREITILDRQKLRALDLQTAPAASWI